MVVAALVVAAATVVAVAVVVSPQLLLQVPLICYYSLNEFIIISEVMYLRTFAGRHVSVIGLSLSSNTDLLKHSNRAGNFCGIWRACGHHDID